MSNFPIKKIEISTSTIIKTAAIIVGIYLLFLVRDIILILLIAITLSSALEPLVSWARSRLKLPRGLTVVVVYVVVLGLIGTFFYTLTPSFVQQFKELGNQYQEFVSGIEQGSGTFYEFLRRIGVDSSLESFLNSFAGRAGGAFDTAIGFLTGVLEIISILVISFYLVVEQQAMRAAAHQLLPEEYREKAVKVIHTIQRKLGLWLLGQLILSLSIFIVTFIVLSVLNIKLALALAALAGLLEIVPFLGPFISAIPAVLIAFTQSPALAVVVVAAYLLIQKAEGYILVPKIMEKTVGVQPLVVLISVLIGFKLAGLFGALLAVPVVAAGSVMVEAYILGKTPRPPEPPEVIKLPNG